MTIRSRSSSLRDKASQISRNKKNNQMLSTAQPSKTIALYNQEKLVYPANQDYRMNTAINFNNIKSTNKLLAPN